MTGAIRKVLQENKAEFDPRGYLKPVEGRPNLTVQTHAHVERLLIEEGRAAAVAFSVKGAPREARADIGHPGNFDDELRCGLHRMVGAQTVRVGDVIRESFVQCNSVTRASQSFLGK